MTTRNSMFEPIPPQPYYKDFENLKQELAKEKNENIKLKEIVDGLRNKIVSLKKLNDTLKKIELSSIDKNSCLINENAKLKEKLINLILEK